MTALKKTFLFFFLLAPFYIFSQNKSIGVFVSNNVASFPVTGYPQLFYSQFHPGIDAIKEWKINKNEKHQLWAGVNAGIFYHRFIQTGLKLYPSIDYKYKISKRFLLNIGLGLGYLHSFEGYEVFKLKDSGLYETKKVWVGRSQYMAALNLGCAYKLKKEAEVSPQLVFQIRTNMQGPYVNNYVPVLPVNSVLLGVSLPLKNK